MKDVKSMGRLAAIAALALATAPAFANDTGRWHALHSDSYQGSYHGRLDRSTNAIHSGAANPSDQALADAVADAFRNDPALFGATATIVANNGRVALNGSSNNLQQSSRAEQVARRVAGVAAVSGTLDPMGG
jgi:osmotically-inducible protein OsmY